MGAFLARPAIHQHGISERRVGSLAEVEMKGRQIKSVLKPAGLLARRAGIAFGGGSGADGGDEDWGRVDGGMLWWVGEVEGGLSLVVR